MPNPNRTAAQHTALKLRRRISDIGLYVAIIAATGLLVAVVIEAEFRGNLKIALCAFFLSGTLAYVDGRIQGRIARLAVLLACAFAFCTAYSSFR
jgi:hypothetical protein